MAIKIIIRREIPKDKEGDLLPLLIDLRTKATAQPGYISGETLRNAENPEDCIVISTWQSAEAWKAWQSNEERKAIHKKIEALLTEETVYGAYYYG